MVKSSTLAVILAAMIISVVLTSEADGAGLVWRAINKTGSSIHHLANVTEYGCALNQVLKVNSTADWACATDGGLTSAVISINSDTTAAQTIAGVSGNTTASTSSGTTTINLGSNVVTTGGSAQTITKGLTINSGTLGGQLNINAQTFLNTGTITLPTTTGTLINNIASESVTASNATLIADNSTTASRASFKTISSGAGITLENNAQNIRINMTTPINVLSGGNLTSRTIASYLTIFDIPLTANTGNFISAYIITDGEIGTSAQFFSNYTSSYTNFGNCMYQHPTAINTISSDLIAIVTPGGTPADTQTTTQLTSNSTTVLINCAVLAGSSPGNLKINFQTSQTNVDAHILPGSFYIKTP